MGLIVTELPTDAHYASEAIRYTNPPAIHRVLPEGEGLEAAFSLYQGSGGEVASLLGITPSGANTQVQAVPQNKLETTVNEICVAFGLTKEELAQVCNVQSRMTLYNWINGKAKPRKPAMSRIFDLLVIARAWVSSGFTAGREQLHEPVLANQSVFDLLNKPEIDKEHILFAGSRLNMLSTKKDKLSNPFAQPG